MKAVYFVLLACLLIFAPLAQAQRAGVINDPDGFVNVRAEKSVDAAVIATVKLASRLRSSAKTTPSGATLR